MILINNEIRIKGRFSFSIEQIGNAIICSGALTCHDYIEEITSIENYRYKLEDITIIKEDFGSHDYDVLYKFTAKKWAIKNDVVSKEIKKAYELEHYKDEEELIFLNSLGGEI